MKRLIETLTGLTLCCMAACGVASCSEEDDCSENSRHMVNATICRSVTVEQQHLTVADTLPVLHVTAIGTDSVIINNQQSVSTASLPLRFNSGVTTLIFSYVSSYADTIPALSSKDTISFSHDNTPYFLSMDCDYAVKQVLTGVTYTTHRIDSIVITNPTANANGTENIRIYY